MRAVRAAGAQRLTPSRILGPEEGPIQGVPSIRPLMLTIRKQIGDVAEGIAVSKSACQGAELHRNVARGGSPRRLSAIGAIAIAVGLTTMMLAHPAVAA